MFEPREKLPASASKRRGVTARKPISTPKTSEPPERPPIGAAGVW